VRRRSAPGRPPGLGGAAGDCAATAAQFPEADSVPSGVVIASRPTKEKIGASPDLATAVTAVRKTAIPLCILITQTKNNQVATNLKETLLQNQLFLRFINRNMGFVHIEWPEDSDVTLRAKVRLVDEAPGRPAVGARFGVTLPETSFGNGLGPNALRMSAQVLVSKTLGAMTLHGNAGLALHDEVYRPHEQRDFLAYGLAAEFRASRRLAVVGEWAGLAGSGMPGADAHSELRAGVRWGAGDWIVDGAVRRGLAEADGTWGVTAGVTRRFR